MARKLQIRDLTLRDGQQSLFATRMKQENVDKLLPLYRCLLYTSDAADD